MGRFFGIHVHLLWLSVTEIFFSGTPRWSDSQSSYIMTDDDSYERTLACHQKQGGDCSAIARLS